MKFFLRPMTRNVSGKMNERGGEGMEKEVRNSEQDLGEDKGGSIMEHFITKYEENGKMYAESWFQMDLFGKSYCFWRKRIEI